MANNGLTSEPSKDLIKQEAHTLQAGPPEAQTLQAGPLADSQWPQ